ncbi:hypothetical protein V6N11_018818 [Hibiscus sabdariffa]|uniref:Uncharacterized protein n=1 Tax=Hibiscus sabdariffa TaxID=183260 RepID=A0ABR2QTQ5_9ROSI
MNQSCGIILRDPWRLRQAWLGKQVNRCRLARTGLRRKRCCSTSGRMASNMSSQHWCTRGQLKEKEKIAPIPAYTWTLKPAVSAQERVPMVAEMP